MWQHLCDSAQNFGNECNKYLQGYKNSFTERDDLLEPSEWDYTPDTTTNMLKDDTFLILQMGKQDSKKTNEMSFKVCDNDQQDQGKI